MNMEVRRIASAAEKAATEQFEQRAGNLPGASWVRDMRAGAIARFAEVGLPHRRIEEWKYTDLRTAVRELPVPADGASAPATPETLAGVDAYRATIVDGVVTQMPETVAGVTFERLEDALARDDAAFRDLLSEWPTGSDSAVLDLNTAFMRDGVVIRIASGTKLDRPVHIAFVTTSGHPSTVYARNVVMIEDEAEATIVETHEGPDGLAYHVNVATRFHVGNAARASYVKVLRDGDSAVHLATVGAEVGTGTNFILAPFTIGAALSRHNLALRFDGADAVANIAGVQVLGGQQHGDTTLFVDHKEPSCASRELFKTVLDDKARGVFQGMILVRQHAQETDGKMMSQALMLSDSAEMDNKPELEIYADNVQCGHGATTGEIDDDLLFYLRTRGIPEDQAQALLIEAFVGEAVDQIPHEGIREALTAYTHGWVSERKNGSG